MLSCFHIHSLLLDKRSENLGIGHVDNWLQLNLSHERFDLTSGGTKEI